MQKLEKRKKIWIVVVVWFFALHKHVAFFLDFFMGLTELKEILTFSVLWVVFYVLENVKAKKKAKADPLISRKKLPAVFLSLWLAKH